MSVPATWSQRAGPNAGWPPPLAFPVAPSSAGYDNGARPGPGASGPAPVDHVGLARPMNAPCRHSYGHIRAPHLPCTVSSGKLPPVSGSAPQPCVAPSSASAGRANDLRPDAYLDLLAFQTPSSSWSTVLPELPTLRQVGVAVGEVVGVGTPVLGDVELLGVLDIMTLAGLTHPATNHLLQPLEVLTELAVVCSQ